MDAFSSKFSSILHRVLKIKKMKKENSAISLVINKKTLSIVLIYFKKKTIRATYRKKNSSELKNPHYVSY